MTSLSEPIPDIGDAIGFTTEEITQARADRTACISLIRRYKWKVVRPRLLAEDIAAYRAPCSRQKLILSVPFATLEPSPAKLNLVFLRQPLGSGDWRVFSSRAH